jgi:hypothetical protein
MRGKQSCTIFERGYRQKSGYSCHCVFLTCYFCSLTFSPTQPPFPDTWDETLITTLIYCTLWPSAEGKMCLGENFVISLIVLRLVWFHFKCKFQISSFLTNFPNLSRFFQVHKIPLTFQVFPVSRSVGHPGIITTHTIFNREHTGVDIKEI